jgi:hypothetical protein
MRRNPAILPAVVVRGVSRMHSETSAPSVESDVRESDSSPASYAVWVRRDADGCIVSVSLEATADHVERVASDDAGIASFAHALTPKQQALRESDLSLIRALEDLIDVLIKKEVLRLTDLPDSVQEKLYNRRQLRGSPRSLDLLGS